MSPAPPEASTSRQPSVELQQDTFTSQNQESREARSEHYGSQGGQVDETSLARYGLVLPDPSLKPDPALEVSNPAVRKFSKMLTGLLQAKLAHFHTVSAQGHDFNSTLERNKSFRNPHILDTLVRFVSVNERGSNLPEEVWDQKNMMEQGNAKRLRAIQKQREQEREERQTKGPRRDKIAFESSSSSSNLSGRGAHRRERSRSPPPRHYDQHRHRERDRDRHRR